MTFEQLTDKINAMDPAHDDYNALCVEWERIYNGEYEDDGDLHEPVNVNASWNRKQNNEKF